MTELPDFEEALRKIRLEKALKKERHRLNLTVINFKAEISNYARYLSALDGDAYPDKKEELLAKIADRKARRDEAKTALEEFDRRNNKETQ